MPVNVMMQLNVGANEAGDWANRRTGQSATPTALLPGRVAHSHESVELVIRLHDLRGAVEAMRNDSHGPTMADTRTMRGTIGYGSPVAYRGLRFILRAG